MLVNTFIHVQGIGFKTERRLWQQGFITWDDLLAGHHRADLPAFLLNRALKAVRQSKESLVLPRPEYFLRFLPKTEMWRLYREFRAGAAFVDLETDGTAGEDSVTMIGIYDGASYHSFIRGRNLSRAETELARHNLWITFGGSNFDLPLLHRLFPRLTGKQLHIDVMLPLRRLNLKGGLKKIERQLGIKRSRDTEGLTGWDAVRLWGNYRRGAGAALDLLVCYNREDCRNLEPLMELAYTRLREHVFEKHLPRPSVRADEKKVLPLE